MMVRFFLYSKDSGSSFCFLDGIPDNNIKIDNKVVYKNDVYAKGINFDNVAYYFNILGTEIPIDDIKQEDISIYDNLNNKIIIGVSEYLLNDPEDLYFVEEKRYDDFLSELKKTGSFCPPKVTTTKRDALKWKQGSIIYNISVHKFQGYEGADPVWVNLSP